MPVSAGSKSLVRDQYISKDECADILKGAGASVYQMGRIWRILYRYAETSESFEARCMTCGAQIKLCVQAEGFLGHSTNVWYEYNYLVKVSSLLEHATALRAYKGRNCGDISRAHLSKLIDEICHMLSG